MQMSSELLAQVRRIEVRMSRMVTETLAGEYHSAFKGQGMEFSEVREYVPGDDVRTIDWNVTARLQKPYIKQYVEERELTVFLCVDVSGSSLFGSGQYSKAESQAELAALLSLVAIRNKDRVGLMLFSDQVELLIPPRKGRSHVLRVIREILGNSARHARTSISQAMESMQKVLKRRSVVFLLSDFLDQGYESALARVARRHDLICLALRDPIDQELPRNGLVQVMDAETGELLLLDSSSYAVGKAYMSARSESLYRARTTSLANGADFLSFAPGPHCLGQLVQFFRLRRGSRA